MSADLTDSGPSIIIYLNKKSDVISSKHKAADVGVGDLPVKSDINYLTAGAAYIRVFTFY